MRRGFTLLEVLISLVVFTTGMLAIVTLSSQTQLLTRSGSVRTRAALLAQEGLETAIANGYATLPTNQPFMNDASLGALGSEYQYFSREVDVSMVDGNLATVNFNDSEGDDCNQSGNNEGNNEHCNLSGSGTGMKLVTVTVRWDARTGDSSRGAKEFVASTIVTDL